MTDIEVIEKVAEGLPHTEYSLLLGAGASVGAVGGNGVPLPTGADLCNALVKDFGIDTGGEAIPLSAAYDYLQRHNREEVSSYLRDWFSGCQPSWQHLLGEFNWNRIWTLNIDDVVEQSFRKAGRLVESVSWKERFSAGKSIASPQVIHLHGLAERLGGQNQETDALVFSLSDYAREIANPRAWHKVFHDEFSCKPFLIIGARLTEEIDLIETLAGGSTARASTGYPSVVVVPDINPIRRDQLEAAGFVIVENDGESFIRQLLNRYREVVSGLASLYGPGTPGSGKFQQQFINLRSYEPHDRGAGDFYSGYQPTWNTILSENDALLDKTNEASSKLIRLMDEEHVCQKILFLTGNPGSGKSTALLRIAADLKGTGAHPFLFRGDEYMDVDATIEWLKAVPRTVLLFDDFADHSSTLHNLSERCKAESVKMLAVASDRSARRPIIRDRIDSQYLDPSDAFWYGRLTNDDVERIIAKLHSRGRLGIITRRNPEGQRRHFVESANRSLFDAMSELEGGAGFRATVQDIYETLPTEGLKKLYVAACLCYDQSIPVPTGIAANLAGVDAKGLVSILENQCNGILVLTRAGIRPPHRITASLVVSTLVPAVRAEVSFALARSLAPHVDVRAIRSGTREYRLVRHLMNHEVVIRDNNGEHAGRDWYEGLRHYYDWNGRYWDQRALFESRYGQHETARSYAERSIQVHPHSFGYNTLGTVLLRTAIRQGSVNSLNDGIKNLDRAKDFPDWGPREHPFTTFFTSLIRYAEEWGIAKVPQEARSDWNNWYREAQSSPVFSTVASRSRLDNWQREWLQLSLGS